MKKLKGFLQRILQEIMKKNTTWNIRRLVDKTIVPWTQRPSILYWRLSDFNFDPPNQKLHNPNKYLVHIMFITQVHKWLAWWKLWVRYRSRPSWHGREWSFYSRNWWRRQSQVIKSLIKIYLKFSNPRIIIINYFFLI